MNHFGSTLVFGALYSKSLGNSSSCLLVQFLFFFLLLSCVPFLPCPTSLGRDKNLEEALNWREWVSITGGGDPILGDARRT